MHLVEKNIQFKKATMDDWRILLEWRNDFQTRKNSHHMDLISESSHKDWLNSILKDKKIEIYIYLEKGKPAGTVRKDWEEKTKSYKLSWTVSPDFRGQGIGKKMVKHLAEQWNGNLTAEIKADNLASIRIAEFAGLKFDYEKDQILHYSNFRRHYIKNCVSIE